MNIELNIKFTAIDGEIPVVEVYEKDRLIIGTPYVKPLDITVAEAIQYIKKKREKK